MGELSGQRGVALFGGTFDPVHNGHLEVAKKAVEALALERVIFLPCRQSPHKDEASGASAEERLEMLRLAVRDLPWAEVSDWEYSQPSPSFSWRTAEAFQEKYPDVRLFWLLGWDQWEVLPSWDRFSYLTSLVEFIVHARNGVSGEEIEHLGVRASFVSGNHSASSSQIRKLIALREGFPDGWVPSKVSDFVLKHGLYLQ